MKNQKERILDYMKEHGGITDVEAYNRLAIRRLGARIYDLKADGHGIVSETIKAKNRYDQPVRITKYMLKERVNDTSNK